MNNKYFFRDTVDAEKCKGCTNCVKNCPTEAIRVRKGTARTIEQRCINCGNCIRTCPYHAKIAITDPLDLGLLKEFKYTIALCSSVLYSQFHRVIPPGMILSAVKNLGFDEVHQEAIGADAVGVAVNELLNSRELKRPIISTSCPAIIRLIQVRFPGLIDNLSPLLPPVEVAAKIVREKASKKLQLPQEQIGVFLITPCVAKASAIKQPLGIAKSYIDGAISLIHLYNDIYGTVYLAPDKKTLATASGPAVGWARSGGETSAINAPNYLVADGLSNVLNLFEEVEIGHYNNVDYIECQCCQGGCVGGPLTVESQFAARILNRKLVKTLPKTVSENDKANFTKLYFEGYFHFDKEIHPLPSMPLDQDINKAIKLVSQIDEIIKGLPGLDCASCGCPSCQALAEDIARGNASMTDCIFVLLKTIRNSAQETMKLIQKDHRIAGSGKERKQ